MKKELKFRIDLAALKGSNVKCNLKCSYCHDDYMNISMKHNEKEKYSFSDLIKSCIDASGYINPKIILHFAGRADPLLISKETFILEIDMIKSNFPQAEFIITTNGIRLKEYAQVINQVGINKINISLHCEYPELEEKIFKGIREIKKYGIITVLNIIATEKVIKNLSCYLTKGDAYNISLKFFSLLHKDKVYTNNLYKTFLKKIKKHTNEFQNQNDNKNKIIRQTISGTKVIIKLPEDFNKRPDACLNCVMLRNCEESCYDNIRLTPWYIKPCGVRDDNVYFPELNDISILKSNLKNGGKLN